jgi:hypothetical protein
MVWTKLGYLAFPQAFAPQRLGRKWVGAAVGSRYRNVLKKEFLKAGVPWEYDHQTYTDPRFVHPYAKPPKEKQRVKNKTMRVERITRALAKQDELQLKYRQDVASKKRLTGVDFVIASLVGNYLKGK